MVTRPNWTLTVVGSNAQSWQHGNLPRVKNYVKFFPANATLALNWDVAGGERMAKTGHSASYLKLLIFLWIVSKENVDEAQKPSKENPSATPSIDKLT